MKIKNLLSITLCVFFLFSCQKEELKAPAQQTELLTAFEKTYGGNQDDFAHSLVAVDEFIYVYGTTKSLNDATGDHYLLKLNSNGEILAEYDYGSAAEEEGTKIILTSNNHLLLIGWTKNTASGKKNIHLLKTDLDGNLLWEKNYGGPEDDFANDILELENGNLLITGATVSFGEGSSDIYLIWIDSDGNMLKEAFHGDVDQDGGTQSIELANQDLMLFGYTWNYGASSRDYYLLKMNSNGDSLWSKRFGGVDYEETHAMSQSQDGGFVLNGHSASTDPIHDMYGVKVDAQGNLIWEKNFGGTAHEGGMAFLINSLNQYVFVGRSMSFEMNQNIFLVTTDEAGNTLSEQFLGSAKADMANAIIEYQGYYYLAGQSDSFSNGDLDVYLYRLPIKN